MKRLFSPVLAVGIMLAAAHLALACTSFAVYGVRGPIFGMNWDLPSSDEAEQSAYGFFAGVQTAWPSTAPTALRYSSMITTSSSRIGAFLAASSLPI
ncbi:hypothetical protein, partial [Candidatus Darwinibacter acetoxidans]